MSLVWGVSYCPWPPGRYSYYAKAFEEALYPLKNKFSQTILNFIENARMHENMFVLEGFALTAGAGPN